MNAISIPPIIMATLMFYVGFYHFLIYRRQISNRENLTFALSCFGVGMYAVCCAGLYNASSPEIGVEWQRFQVITLAVLAIVLLWFIADYTNRTNKKIVIGFTVYFLFAAVSGLIIRSNLTWTNVTSIKEIQLPIGYHIRYNEMVPGVLTDFQGIVGLIYFIYIFMVSLKFYKSGNKEKGMPLLIAMAVLFAGSLNDTLVSSGFYDFIYILEYSYIGMILVFTLFFTNNVIKAGEIKVALQKSEKKYRALFEKTNDAIFVVEKSTGRYLDANDAASELTGRTLEELKQLTTHDITPKNSYDRLSKINNSGGTVDLGNVIYHKEDNSHRIAKLSAVPMNDNAVIGIARDITHDLEIEKQLRQSQKMEAIGTLAGGIAHDFNNILSGIFGYTQLAEMNLDDSQKVKKNLGQIIKGAQRAAELVNQILTFSRQVEYNLIPLKLSLVVKEATRFLRSSIPSSIVIEEKISSQAMVLADSTMTHQVVMNLCTNAFHAMLDSGGTLTIELSDIEITTKDHSATTSYMPGNYVKLEIRDTGHGMNEETLEKIFEPYFTSKQTDKGTGLGLAVVDGIVKKHKGFIKTYSKVGTGSTFQVFWPAIEIDDSL